MQLREAQQAFKFAGGIETKMDPKAVPAVRLLDLQNGVFTKAISIKKRNGYSRVSRAREDSASLVSGALKLGARDDELLLFTQNRCYSKKTTDDFWTDAGACIAAIGRDRPAVHTGTAQTMPDHATNGGVAAYAWEDSLGGVWWTTVDATSGRVYRAPTQANAAGQRPRCVAVGAAIHIYFVVPAQHFLYTIVINPSSPSAAVAPVLTVEDIDTANPVYDAVPTTRTGTPALIAWHEHATTRVRVGYVDASGALGSPVTGHPSVYTLAAALVASSPLAVAYTYGDGGAGDGIALAFVAGAGGTIHLLTGGSLAQTIGGGLINYATVVYVAPISVARIALAVTSTTAWAVFEEAAAQSSQRFSVVGSLVNGAVVGATQTIRSIGLASRAFVVADDPFVVFVHDTTYFNTYMTLRVSDFAPAGRQLAAQASGAPTRSHQPSVNVADNVATVVLPYKQRVSSTNNDTFAETALRRVTLDFSDLDTHQTAQIGRGLYLAAGCPQHYDGRLWTEQGFNFGPEYVPVLPANGGALTINSRYGYTVWYEWTDAQGEIHRGPTSVNIIADTGAGDNQVTLTLPTLRVTRKSNVRICVGRCLPGDTSRYWRVSSLDPTTSGAVNGYVANNTTVDSISFIDRMSDASLQLQEQVYTNGGILSDDPCSLGSIVAVGKNRLFFADASEGSVVRFSQRLATGYGAEIPPELAHDIDTYGGDITALAVMDDVVYVFKASCIFAFNGDGPFETGSTASAGPTITGFSASQIITSDVGCTDPSSIVLTPAGLMFKSAKGIWLLSRSRQVSYVGAPVEAYNTQNVRRATVLPDRTGVVFLTDSGSTLYYDYSFEQWSRFTNHEGLDAAVVAGSYHYLRTNDIVFRETLGEYSDGGSSIKLCLETAWLHMQEHLQGFQRFWYLHLLGTWISAHQLGISYRKSYEDDWCEPSWLDATGGTDSDGWLTGEGCMQIGLDPLVGTAYGDGLYGAGVYGGTADDVYRWRFGVHEEGESIQFRFEDFEKAGLAGASFELTEMKITGGVMPDPAARPARSM